MSNKDLENSVYEALADPDHPKCIACMGTGMARGEYTDGLTGGSAGQCPSCVGSGKLLSPEQLKWLRENSGGNKQLMDTLKGLQKGAQEVLDGYEKTKNDTYNKVGEVAVDAWKKATSWI